MSTFSGLVGGTTRRPSWFLICHAAPLLSAPPPFNSDRRNWLAVRTTGRLAGGPEFKPRSRHFCSPAPFAPFCFLVLRFSVSRLSPFILRISFFVAHLSICTPRMLTLLDLYPSSVQARKDPTPPSPIKPTSTKYAKKVTFEHLFGLAGGGRVGCVKTV